MRRDDVAAVINLVGQFTPVLAAHSSEIRGAALAELMSQVLAEIQGERKHAERREAMRKHVLLIHARTKANEAILLGKNGRRRHARATRS